jgi:hypothetical protein
MKMVFNQISEEESTSSDQEYSIKKKIFTCEELEGRKMSLSKLLLTFFDKKNVLFKKQKKTRLTIP